MKIHLKLSFLDVGTYKLSKYIFLLFIDDAQRNKLTVYNSHPPRLGGLEWVYKWIIDFHGQFPEWWSSTAPLTWSF